MHIARVKASELAFIAGQVAVDQAGNVVGPGDFDAQCVRTFRFAVSAGIGRRRPRIPALFPNGAYPPDTLLIVDRLGQENLLIEVQAVAAL